jgi:hypothetical protein
MMRKLVFIFGLARSGTNLLTRILARHPAVTIALDPFLPLFRSLRNAIVRACAPQPLKSQFQDTGPFQDYYFDANGYILLDAILDGTIHLPLSGKELEALRKQVAERTALESPSLAGRMDGLSGETYYDVLTSGLQLIAAQKPDATWVGCKEVWIIDFLPLLARAFPHALFYIMERDPRAIAASLLAIAEQAPSQSAHLPSYIRHWRKQVALTRHLMADPGLCRCFRVISYEKLACAPQDETRRICRDMDIDFHSSMLELSRDGWQGNSSYDHTDRNVYTSSIDRWQLKLSDQVVRAIDFMSGPEMLLTPYRPIGKPCQKKTLPFFLNYHHNHSFSWRSDSNDLITDFGGDLMRHALLDVTSKMEESLSRRCFLFPETLVAIREAMKANQPAKRETNE